MWPNLLCNACEFSGILSLFYSETCTTKLLLSTGKFLSAIGKVDMLSKLLCYQGLSANSF